MHADLSVIPGFSGFLLFIVRGASPVAISGSEFPAVTRIPTHRRLLVNAEKCFADSSLSLPPFTYPSLRCAINTLRLSGGAGKKRDAAPSPRAPAKKHAVSGSMEDDGDANSPAENADTSRNWDVQKVISEC